MATVEIIKVYKALDGGNAEGCFKKLIGYFTSETIAKEESKAKGGWGVPEDVFPVNVVKITEGDKVSYYLDNPIEISVISNTELRNRALKKLNATLSPEEINALGLLDIHHKERV